MKQQLTIGICLLSALFACQRESTSLAVRQQPVVQRYFINRPEVRQHLTPFPDITFQEGDIVTVNSGGCYQTGGAGLTWKLYVDPLGDNAERLYHGLIWIPGATAGLETIKSIMARSPLVVGRIPVNADRSQMYLRLGVDDDNYSDNGYWGRDDGQYAQCRGVEDAWVDIAIEHGPPPPVVPPCPPMPVDLYWSGLDENMLPLNARWGTQCTSNPDSIASPITNPSLLCNYFLTDSRHHLDLGPYCTRALPTVDSKDAPFWCGAPRGVNGHINFGFGTYTGRLYWDNWSSCADPEDCDYNMRLIPPHYEGTGQGNGRIFGEPTLQLEFDARETRIAYIPPILPWWRAFATGSDQYRRDTLWGQPAIATGVINFDNVHQAQTEIHPVVGLAIQVSATDTEEVWAIMARRGGNQGGCSSDALHGLHDPELGEFRFSLNSSPTQGSTVLSGTQFKWVGPSASGDTGFSVDFGTTGTLLRVPLQPYGRAVFGELHITPAPRPPQLISVSPDRGPNTGGTLVTLTGANFAPGATVTFGGAAAMGVTFVSPGTLTATTPAHTVGAIGVQVTVNERTGSLSNAFTYVLHPAQIMTVVNQVLQ